MGNIPKLYTGNLIFKYRHTFNQLNHDNIHLIIWQTHTCILKKYVSSSYTKISHLIFSWENGLALPSGINIICSGYLSFSATGYLKPPFYVWEILLPNRTKPIFHCKGWKWQTLAFPAILREVLAPGQSSTTQWPPLKNLIWKLAQSLGWEDPLKEEMATHSSILAWKIPWTEEPGRLQSTRSQRIRHDWASEQQYLRNQVLVVGATPLSQAQQFHQQPPGAVVLLVHSSCGGNSGRLQAQLCATTLSIIPSSQKDTASYYYSLINSLSGGLLDKKSPCNAGDEGSIPGQGTKRTKIPQVMEQLRAAQHNYSARMPQLQSPSAATKDPSWCNEDPVCHS